MSAFKIVLIGADSTILAENTLDDVFHREVLKTAYVALMDIDPARLEGSYIVVRKLMDSTGANGKITCHIQQKEALGDADFVMVAFQIGGCEPYTVTDLEVCKWYGLEQTIVDALGPGDIMRALRIILHLWQTCGDMTEVYPDATMLNYVNPMAMDTWTIYARYPHIEQVGLYHSVQGTAEELARDLNIDPTTLRYRCAGIGHMAFHLELERKTADDSYVNFYPELLTAYEAGQTPRPNTHGNTRCRNIVRYEMFKELGYFVTESSEHLAEYIPWFAGPGREDLTKRYKVPLDEYPKHCVEQPANRHKELEEYRKVPRIDIRPSRGYVSTIMDIIWTNESSMIHGDVRNDGLTDNLP